MAVVKEIWPDESFNLREWNATRIFKVSGEKNPELAALAKGIPQLGEPFEEQFPDLKCIGPMVVDDMAIVKAKWWQFVRRFQLWRERRRGIWRVVCEYRAPELAIP